MPKPNKETQKIFNEGEKIAEWVKNESWQLVKKKLYDKLITTDSIITTPTDGLTPEQILTEYQVRKGAISLILNWINEIEGRAAQHKNNIEAFKEIRQDSIVQFFDIPTE